MQFKLTEEQVALQDNVRRWVQKNYNFAQRRVIERSEEGFSRAHWATMAELGWLSAAFPEEVGGLGGTIVDAAIIAEELGRALVLEPYVAVGVLAAEAINAVGTRAQREALLPAVLMGESLTVLAHGEQAAGGEVGYVETHAAPVSGGWRLRGKKSLVLFGPAAETFLISARMAGAPGDEHGVTLFAVPSDRTGLALQRFRTTDGRPACDILLDAVEVRPADVIGDIESATPGLRRAYAVALAILCAEAVGVMDQALWTTRDYLHTRQQFGVPLSTFQVLQHRASDMYVAVQQARAAVWRAMAHLDGTLPQARDLAVASAKAQIGRAGHFVCGQSIQLHGGIGVTEEYVIGHHFKRMMVIEQIWGSTQHCLKTLAAEITARQAAA